MTQYQKRRLEIDEAVKEKRQIVSDIRERLRNAKTDEERKTTGDDRSKIEQATLDIENLRKELEEINKAEQDHNSADALFEQFDVAAARHDEIEGRRGPALGQPANGSRPEHPADRDSGDDAGLELVGWRSANRRSTLDGPTRDELRALRDSDKAFKSWRSVGHFLKAVQKRSQGLRASELDAYEHRAPTQFGELIDQDGGHLVPPQFTAQLLQATYETGAIISRCTTLPMTSNINNIPAVDETSRVDGSRRGGVRAYWVEEGVAPTQSKGKFRMVKLELAGLACTTTASDDILEDATLLGAWIARTFPEEMAFVFEDAIYEGDGAGKPLGIMAHPAQVSVAKEGAQAADTIVFANINKMRARAHRPGSADYIWLTNQDTFPQLAGLEDTNGNAVWLPGGMAAGRPLDTLWGRPVVPAEYAETLGDKGDIHYVNFSEYLIGERAGGIQSATSIHVKFEEFEQTFRWKMRVAGQPWWHKAMTPFKGTATQSPFVTLDERA